MGEKKKLPIGIEFFKNFKTDGYYYVDKTGFISELLRTKGSVNLFTRPRRFGKSLNIDMIKSFFELDADASLFEGLDIADEKALCEKYMGKYPVISISLKDVEGENYKVAYDSLGILISEEAERYGFLIDSERLTASEKNKFQRMMDGDFENSAFLYSSLKLLTRLLRKHFDMPVIVLIDEYDVPLDKAYQKHYYTEMVQLVRSFFSQGLKTNPNLYFAVITGCLRIAKESIFTGLNNFKVRTISDVRFAEYFGFTDEEVRAMLSYYGLEDKYSLFREWYDGYHFGDVDIYCPWDVINQCDKFCENKNSKMEFHWANSSNNAIIQDILDNAVEETRADIETLISGQYLEKPLLSEVTYSDLDNNIINAKQIYLWSILFATGYVTDIGESESGLHKLVIPNKEIYGIYETKIKSWFRTKAVEKTDSWNAFCTAFKDGNGKKVQDVFNEFLSDSISIRDTCVQKEMKENFYHGLLLGLLKANGKWIAKSNAESGIGYTDIKLIIPSEKTGCIIEVKYAENGKFDSACQRAMKQIDLDGYVTACKQEGMTTIYKFGIACYKKTCKVICSQEI